MLKLAVAVAYGCIMAMVAGSLMAHIVVLGVAIMPMF